MKDITLLNGDCLELMKDIPDGSVDMVLCDLPYGTTRNKWDSVLDLNILWKQYKRIIKENGAIVLFAQTPFDKVLGASNLEMLRYEWIWEKDNATGFLNANKMPLKIHENILVFYKNPPTYNPQMRQGFDSYKVKQGSHSCNYGKQSKDVVTNNYGERFPIDILTFCRDKDMVHPTQKPIKLLQYLIKTYTNENQLVLDNTMGSGSTGVAAILTKRKFIGIEMDENYFNVATKRIKDAQKEMSSRLF